MVYSQASRMLDRGETMAEMWAGYRAKVHPELHPDSWEHKRYQAAFYAGALCLFNWFMVQLDPEAEPTEADLSKVSKMEEEINSFFNQFV